MGEILMRKKWRTRVIEIDAIQYDGTNIEEIKTFVGAEVVATIGTVMYSVRTPDGKKLLHKHDYVIKGLRGELYVFSERAFHTTYERNLIWDDNI